MTHFRKCALLPAVAAILLSGCAGSGQFPSLARRPQEDVPGRITGTLSAPPVAASTASPEPAVEAADQGQADRLMAQARTARESFLARRGRADQLARAASGAQPGSEAWSVAAVSLAELSSARDSTVTALADMDAIYVRQRIDGGDGGAIAAVRDQVTAWVADEDAVLAELGGHLRS